MQDLEASRIHRLQFADLGVSTRVIDAGSGPPVLMLHGNPDNADEWRPLIARIAGRHRCIAPDFPGFGQSPEPPRSFGYTLQEQVHFVDAVLAALKIDEPVILVVHDTGGMSGTAWAAANTRRVRGIVFTNTAVFEQFEWFPIAHRWANTSPLMRLRNKLLMSALGWNGGALFRRSFGATAPQLDAAQLDRFVESFALNRAAKSTTLRQFHQMVPHRFFDGFEAMRLGLVDSVPCRVLWGDSDPFIPVRYAQRFGGSPVKILPAVGHWVPIVAANQLAAEVVALG
jgi:pimeloyl-ACP methyl ester carboxylesterase